MDANLISEIREGGILFLLLLVAITMHEYGHALVANMLGDNGPKEAGRVTVNPLAHIDRMGTIILPIITIAMSMGSGFPFVFGWGKPVYTRAPNPKTARRFEILTSLAGVSANLILALISAILAGVLARYGFAEIARVAVFSVILNCALFVINILPIPPLDGGHILKNALNMDDEKFLNMARWGMPILLLIFILPFTNSILTNIIGTISAVFLAISNIIASYI